MVAAGEIGKRDLLEQTVDYQDEINAANAELTRQASRESAFPVMYLRQLLSETMREDLGIVRSAEKLRKGIADLDYYLSVADKISFDASVMVHEIYSIRAILTLARAVLVSALGREESRGAHVRADHPNADEAFAYASIISYDDGAYHLRLDREHRYES